MTIRPFGLSVEQVRVLGSLAEKAATTPDTYPLSSNALRTACNQRSSRDPVVDYDDETVTAALLALRERGLAKTIRGAGSRVYKHAHRLDEALELDAAMTAVLAVLALRGAQTPGEIKTRTERQHRFGSLEEVDDTLSLLASRNEPLVERLEREPGKKEARWRQLLDVESSATETEPAPESGSQPDPQPDPPTRLAEEREARSATLEDITARIQRLEQSLDEIRRRLDAP